MGVFLNIAIAASNRPINRAVITPYFTFESTDYIHIMTNGQSLSNGAETTPRLSTVQISDNVMIGDSDRIDLATDKTSFYPLGGTEGPEAIAAPLANALKTRLASDLPSHQLNNQIFIATNTGTGGRTVSELTTTTEYALFTDAITSANNIVDGLGKTISCPFIVYMQGETEDSGSKEVYKTNLLNHFNKMRNDTQAMYGQTELPKIVVYMPKDPKAIYVKEAYYELFQENDWIIQAGGVYPVPNRGIHLDPNGSRWYGEMLAKAVFQTIQSGVKFQPLYPTNVEIIGSDVVLTYNKNVVFDEVSRPGTASNLKGFQISYNLQQTVFIQNGNQVVITTNQADLAAHGATLEPFAVAYKNGYLRDEDSYLATTNYEDYVFDGGNPIVNQTYDASGNIIYGQKYPMWNWGLPFYVSLK